MSKAADFFADVKAHWSTPDTEKGKYVSYKEYAQIFGGVAFNYGAQSALEGKYVGFASSCFLIMYHYNLPYLAFSVISLIGLPMSYLWNIMGWIINDNLGYLGKKRERRFISIYGAVMLIGLALIIFDVSSLFSPDSALITWMNSLSGITAKSFFKIFGIQLFVNSFSGVRGIFWRKKLIPKYGRFKYTLYSDVIQKCILMFALGWLPIYNIPDTDTRVWTAYLLFSLFGTYDFSRKIENCCDLISPNSAERIWIRTYPVKLSHLLKNIFDAIIPVCAAASFIGGFESIKFYKFVLPLVFIPTALATLFFANRITERIPQPPIEKKQEIPFWYGVKEVMHNKYLWINTITGLIDSMGNGMLDIATLIFLYTLRLDGLEYGLITTLYSFRGTIPTFFAPYFIKRFPYKKLKIFEICMSGLQRLLWILCLLFLGNNMKLCGWMMFIAVFCCAFISTPSSIASSDMNIRLGDYQMYRSGERLSSFQGVYGWFTGPITTLVGLIIPLLLLRNGFNNRYDILFLDSARNGILIIPLVIDLIGFIFMTIPPLFWDYNIDQHEYVMKVLIQRSKLAEEGYIPATYEGGLDFEEPVGLKDGIPVNAGEILKRLEAEKAAEAELTTPADATE